MSEHKARERREARLTEDSQSARPEKAREGRSHGEVLRMTDLREITDAQLDNAIGNAARRRPSEHHNDSNRSE